MHFLRKKPNILFFLVVLVAVIQLSFLLLSRIRKNTDEEPRNENIWLSAEKDFSSSKIQSCAAICLSNEEIIKSLRNEISNLKNRLNQKEAQFQHLLQTVSSGVDGIRTGVRGENKKDSRKKMLKYPPDITIDPKTGPSIINFGADEFPIWSFDEKYVYKASPPTGHPRYSVRGKRVQDVTTLISSASKTACRFLTKQSNKHSCGLVHGNLRADLVHGLEFVFIMRVMEKGLVRVTAKKNLDPEFVIQYHNVPSKENKINIVTILSDQVPLSRLNGFISMLKNLKLHDIKLYVVFVLYAKGDNADVYTESIEKIGKSSKNIKIRVSHQEGKFERALARHKGASEVPEDELMMFIDIDISINFDFIEKCLLYTKKGETVYFPVVFSTFNPGLSDKRRRKKDFVISVNHGVWRMVGYGNLCVYKTDYVFIGGYNTSITGWGWEDTELYQRFRASSKYSVVRAPDPGIIHRWHKKECKNSTAEEKSRYNACLSSSYAYEGPQKAMVNRFIKNRMKI